MTIVSAIHTTVFYNYDNKMEDISNIHYFEKRQCSLLQPFGCYMTLEHQRQNQVALKDQMIENKMSCCTSDWHGLYQL